MRDRAGRFKLAQLDRDAFGYVFRWWNVHAWSSKRIGVWPWRTVYTTFIRITFASLGSRLCETSRRIHDDKKQTTRTEPDIYKERDRFVSNCDRDSRKCESNAIPLQRVALPVAAANLQETPSFFEIAKIRIISNTV